MEETRELERLENISNNSLYAAGINTQTIKMSVAIFQRYMKKNNTLELGPAEGIATELLIQAGHNVTVVEGSKKFCCELEKRYPQIEVCHSLFENFQSNKIYDNIVLGHVLEHVENPEEILRNAKEWLAPEGMIFAAVPNSQSIHRQAAVMMGLLRTESELNEMDIHHGHRRVYNPASFRALFMQAGLNIEVLGGYWLKPISNKQIESQWTPAMVDSFMRLGERYPDIAAEIYVVAKNAEEKS